MKELFIRTDSQRQWLQKLNHLRDDIIADSKNIDEQSLFPFKNFETLRKIGYPKVTLPKEYGGEGLSVYDMILLQETLASFDANTSLAIGWTLGVVGELYEHKLWKPELLKSFSLEVQKNIFINRAASEARTGSPTRGGRPGTYAKRLNNGWILNGHKIFTTASPILDYFLVSAWIEDKQQIAFFLIKKGTPGLTIKETWDVMSMRGTGSHDLILEDVYVEDKALVEYPQNPFGGNHINGWMLHIPSTYLGIAQAARDYAVTFANQHQPNSLKEPISSLPNVQQHLGNIELKLDQARFTLYGVAEVYDDIKRRKYLTNELAVAKHTVTNAAIEIVDLAMRVVGAKSLQTSNPLQRYYRDVRAGLHNPPMDDMTITKLARTALKKDSKSPIYS
ncbi:acyl-CoA dehydrogenase [Rummeliibacillus sp. TYF005]|uniref:acyl-CoA dehydrogenase family protein n=1 Tax=unclassified Rummeliibacillus TaxID=2622809 RepID=UPI000E6713E3|nr:MULTISPECIES: acyl-CoA dehydrogenase family protein [unclassified Rummeliibacillus]RIJ63260.1 acyl-CoA dehydrogenase [Rummeliibacillus sp. POC4]RPJ94311.1 acyl-CoA dehydrogenase [Rummeliibacillus sp. TYF005]